MEEQTRTFSPLPKKAETKQEVKINFYQALKEVENGKKIYKLAWEDKGFYGFLNNGILSLHKPDGNNYQWIISNEDLKGNDWIVIG
jgi:hypothetical protein